MSQHQYFLQVVKSLTLEEAICTSLNFAPLTRRRYLATIERILSEQNLSKMPRDQVGDKKDQKLNTVFLVEHRYYRVLSWVYLEL